MLWCAPALLSASALAVFGWPLPIVGTLLRAGTQAISLPLATVTYLQLPMTLSIACRHPASWESTQVCTHAPETEHWRYLVCTAATPAVRAGLNAKWLSCFGDAVVAAVGDNPVTCIGILHGGSSQIQDYLTLALELVHDRHVMKPACFVEDNGAGADQGEPATALFKA